jgi:hypothetical protein
MGTKYGDMQQNSLKMFPHSTSSHTYIFWSCHNTYKLYAFLPFIKFPLSKISRLRSSNAKQMPFNATFLRVIVSTCFITYYYRFLFDNHRKKRQCPMVGEPQMALLATWHFKEL